jgi:hypothetical protein
LSLACSHVAICQRSRPAVTESINPLTHPR